MKAVSQPVATDIWRIHHRTTTVSTNLDARGGSPGDVFTADFQSAGRGRLAHRWESPAGANLLMSAVLDVRRLPIETAALLPLVAGLAVLRGVGRFLPHGELRLKWPNDVLLSHRKLAGILCERVGDVVIAGIGVNVRPQEFPPSISARAAFIGGDVAVSEVRDAVLENLSGCFNVLVTDGFAPIHREIASVDFLKGRRVSVRQTDDDPNPVSGICDGIAADGSLSIGGRRVFAGETHYENGIMV